MRILYLCHQDPFTLPDDTRRVFSSITQVKKLDHELKKKIIHTNENLMLFTDNLRCLCR